MPVETLRRSARSEVGGHREVRRRARRQQAYRVPSFRHALRRRPGRPRELERRRRHCGPALGYAALPTAGHAEPGVGLSERPLHPAARRHHHDQIGYLRDRGRDPGLSRAGAVGGPERSGPRSSGVVIGRRLAVVRHAIFGPVGALHDRRPLDRARGNGGIECWAGGQSKRRSRRRPPVGMPSCAKIGSSPRPRAIRFPPRMGRSIEMPSALARFRARAVRPAAAQPYWSQAGSRSRTRSGGRRRGIPPRDRRNRR